MSLIEIFSLLDQNKTFMFPYEEEAEHLQHSATLIFQSVEKDMEN